VNRRLTFCDVSHCYKHAIQNNQLSFPDQWVHIVGTYNAQSKQAKVYINSNLIKQGVGSGSLSADWESYAGFGRHPKGAMQAVDILDELYMYSRELSPYEVKMLYQACNFGNARKGMSLILKLLTILVV
jgi:hypothetical protein